MTTIDKSGLDIEEIIREFRREHNIADHELKYEILKKPSKGLLGLFANKIAIVRFNLPSEADRVCLFTEALLEKMGVSFGKVKSRQEGKTLFLTLEGIVESGFIIGKNGNMLETVQYLINRVFENSREIQRIYLDADGYRKRKENQFLNRHIEQINKVASTGKTLTLEPMTAQERRIIHRHVEKNRALRTLTVGEGEKKRVVIFPANHEEAKLKAKQTKAPKKSGGRELNPKQPSSPVKDAGKKFVPDNRHKAKSVPASAKKQMHRPKRPKGRTIRETSNEQDS